MNRPPLVVAQQGKRRAIVLDPNPQLGDIVLGRTEILHWADKTGRKWAGRLTYPASYKTSEHYPLVIQNHGFAAESQFSLYGPGRSPRTGPGWSVWLAQPLASLGIAVLQFGRTDPPLENRDDRTPFAYLKTVCDARAAAIVELTRRGIASERVGLQGFSASGRQVEYDLTFGEFPYAAAIIDDAAGHNYLRTVLDREPMSDTTGVMPYGDDLKLFMEHSPAFNIERIKTPIQFHVNGPGRQMILSSWELFSNLRAAGRVAELYVIPNVERGSHLTPNPRQLVNKQQRAIDWWRFWLQDYEDQAAEKSAQYSDWRRMREQARRVVR
jgi:hypothetical protein